ncbi:MAG: T9SS type A sorting domain-containing protein [Fimbriimonadaceae bacterium]|nr:T9SS type A sorting domain-containing protein [Chitinophagales bacterium]
MKTLFLLLLCIAMYIHNIQTAFTQNISWIRQQGNSADLGIDNASSTDAMGNIYVTGTTPDPAYFDDVTVDIDEPDNNVFVAKYSTTGEVIWVKGYGSHNNDVAYDIAADEEGNTYIVGHSSENITFGSYTLYNYDERDGFVVKSDPDGNVVWAKSITNTGPMHAFAISLFDTSIYITGDISSSFSIDGHTFSSGSVDVYLLKLNTSGGVIWGKAFSSTSNDFGFDLKNDNEGNIILAGSFFGDIDFGSIGLNGTGARNMFVAKFDADGNELWAAAADCDFADANEARAVAINDEGSVYVTGYFSGNLYLDTTILTSSEDDVFILKYSKDGNLLWAKQAGGENNDDAYAIEKNASGGVYVAGNCGADSDTYFDSIIIPSNDTKSMFLASYSSNGIINTVQVCDEITPNHIYLVNDSTFYLSAFLDSSIAGSLCDTVSLLYSNRNGLLIQFHDNSYICKKPDGLYADAITESSAAIHWNTVSSATEYELVYTEIGSGDSISVFTSITSATIELLSPFTTYNYFVKSYCSFGGGDTINGINSDISAFTTDNVNINNITNSDIQIYPNPTKEVFTMTLPEQYKSYTLKIYEITGKVIYENNMLDKINEIDLNGNKGLFYLKISDGKNTLLKPVLIL